ncbi:DNA-binding HORMA family protein isoform 1 [Theobroma cacao]|uniref:DNA-binding HORMA family protein isoform 1 n=1 Tax=Theobroma cacao TaxID=3641 RepID=A0A061F8V9_THECC|nr:DNA-binding HORMA family protein isoform 1 [Theobroma cacao]
MERKDNQSPRGHIAGILVEFLEVAITSVVFLKGIYSPGAFERRRYMNVVVQRARHPQLRDYIHSAVSGLLPFIEKSSWDAMWKCCPSYWFYENKVKRYQIFFEGLVERVAVIFFNTDNIPVERFMFKLTVNQSFDSKVEESDLEFSLRSFLIKLSVSQPLTKVLPCDCRWEITAYFRSLPQVRNSKDTELWISTDTKQWQQPPLITPIKSMNSEPLGVQLFLEHPSPSEPKS